MAVAAKKGPLPGLGSGIYVTVLMVAGGRDRGQKRPPK